MEDKGVRSNFKLRVGELIDIEALNLWKSFPNSNLKASDEIGGKKLIQKNREDTRWWNEEVRSVIASTKEKFKTLCNHIKEESRIR